ncbi:MAG TPA: hypothetical protein VEL03_18305 [Streptosporangiaceae bacterium]|nr:hypothetical protein [Streptosporangiaceae bacterium]
MSTYTRQPTRSARPPRPAEPTVLILDGQLPVLREQRLRRLDRLLARWRGFSLDAQLAAGVPPEATRLLAVRARMLVSPGRRERLARNWALLLRTARQRPSGTPRVPLCRDRILAAEPDIRAMEHALRARLPVPASGVAMASHLLADAAGPVYNRRSAVDLAAAVRAAISHLDPSAGLMPGEPA